MPIPNGTYNIYTFENRQPVGRPLGDDTSNAPKPLMILPVGYQYNITFTVSNAVGSTTGFCAIIFGHTGTVVIDGQLYADPNLPGPTGGERWFIEKVNIGEDTYVVKRNDDRSSGWMVDPDSVDFSTVKVGPLTPQSGGAAPSYDKSEIFVFQKAATHT